MNFVSIIIPAYNSAITLREAINSALGQTYKLTEVIVIDDGSTDRSVDVLRSFGASIRWETGPNRGGCAARNRGLQLASGDRIQFLDADDSLYPHKLQKQIDSLTSAPGSTPICDWEILSEGQPPKRHVAPETCQDSLVPLLNSSLQTSSPLHLKANLVRVGGFREDLPCSQERDLHLRLASYGWPIHRIAEPLYAVRRLPGSVSGNYERVLDQHAGIASRVREILMGRGAWTDTNARQLASFLTRDARAYMGMRREDKAAQYFALARDFHTSGGWDIAYGRMARWGATILGPIALERLRLRLRHN